MEFLGDGVYLSGADGGEERKGVIGGRSEEREVEEEGSEKIWGSQGMESVYICICVCVFVCQWMSERIARCGCF